MGGRTAGDQIDRHQRKRERRAAGNERHDAGQHAERDGRGHAGDPVGDAEDDAFADGDQRHAGYGRADGGGHDPRNAFPPCRQDAFTHQIDLTGEACAIAVNEEQRDQHEQQGQHEMERAVAGGEDRPVDITDIGAADELDELADGARRADIFHPLFAEPGADGGKGGDPVRHGRTRLVDVHRPAEPFADFGCRIGGGDEDRHHEEGNDEDDGDGGTERRVAAHLPQKPRIDRPAGETDDEGGENRNQKAVEEIDARKDDQKEQPARSRNRRDQGDPRRAGGTKPSRFATGLTAVNVTHGRLFLAFSPQGVHSLCHTDTYKCNITRSHYRCVFIAEPIERFW
ncbi:hypothetical protein D3C87_878100 [compost metagenome]